MRNVYRKFSLCAALLLTLCLAACSGGTSEEERVSTEPVTLTELRLECSAPNGGADFPAAARDFASVLQTALAAEGITAETLTVSFSRADAATAQALADGGVTLGVLSPLAALRQESLQLIALLGSESGGSTGVIAAADSAYGAQLACRAAGAGDITWAEWSRAVVGAVESDALLYTAADYALTESTDHGLSQLGGWRTFETEEELLAAMDAGEIDAALLRGESAGERAVLLTTVPVYDAALAAPSGAALPAEALFRALSAALETAEGQAFLRQYHCGAWIAAEKETTETLRRLAEWEDIQ